MSDDERPGDDNDDDLQLKQMRSVWLSMRDDDAEPSDRGMAALMSAAREQAEAMKPKRSWWAVVLEQLRRPPVLAMATVVVLIGGAVVISGRSDEMKTEAEMAEPVAEYAADRDVAAPPPTPDGLATQQAPGSSNVRAPSEGGVDSAAAVSETPPVVAERPRAPKPKPTRSAGPRPAQAQGTSRSMTPDEPAAEAKLSKSDVAPMELASGDDMQPKGGESTSAGAPQPTPPVSRKPLPSIEGEDRRDTTVAQLVKQCEAAAAKNDCAAVRTIAHKIAKQDPSTYRLKVAKNAAVARCLEPAAPVEAAPPAN